MDSKNIIKVYTTTSGAELSISAPSTKQIIDATNNRAQYFAEQALKYRDEAKQYRDNAKYYADQNSDVTYEYINNIKSSLEYQIEENLKLCALKTELPIKVSELENDALYINNAELQTSIDEVRLPAFDGTAGKVLMSNGESKSWVGINTFQLFDTKLSDHLLEGEESLGWALQGTFVSKAIYPDFYAKCLEQKESATATETTLSGSTITLYNNSNGHKFYNIADKAIIDTFYNAMGIAWFYGIDTENERVFLPRNKYLTSYVADGAKTVSVYGTGMALGLTDGSSLSGLIKAGNYIGDRFIAYGKPVGQTLTGDGIDNNKVQGITKDPTKSGITGSLILQNSDNESYVYICVGNTTVNEALVDVGQLSSDLQYKTDKTEVDGQWVSFPEIIEVGSPKSLGAYTFDISNYLPNDGYIYDVFLECGGSLLKGGTGTIAMNVSSSVIPHSCKIAQMSGDDSANQFDGVAISLPIGTDRVLTVSLTGSSGYSLTNSYVYLYAYRRLGTNL